MPTKRKRQRNAQANLPNKKASVNTTLPLSPSPDATSSSSAKPLDQLDSKSLATVVSEEEIEIAVETLDSLSQYPALIKSKACRNLRTAVYGFKQACTTGMNTAETNLTSRVSAAIIDGKYVDAIVLLAEMRIRNQAPKLGALNRWVRDLDVVSGLSSETPDIRTETQLELLRVMDMLLRVTGPVDEVSKVPSTLTGPLSLQPIWDNGDKASSKSPVRQSVIDKSIFENCARDVKDKFRILETTPGPDRKPPNVHPAVVYLSNDNAVQLDSKGPSTTFHKHPTVPNLSLMKDVLSKKECMSIVAAMETIGFLPDCPLRDDGSASSILAHNVYWVVDKAFHDALWSRVAPHIPSHVGGRKARGINRRFRVYRYVPGAEYRCHFDGGWPPSGVDPKTGAYVYDASPVGAKQSSLFTFLVYLNDEFEGGETTFFTPSIREGVMNAHPVRPTMGSVALFPHGDAKGALLHEGTGVRTGVKAGATAKYIIRTDVEFDVEPGCAL